MGLLFLYKFCARESAIKNFTKDREVYNHNSLKTTEKSRKRGGKKYGRTERKYRRTVN